MVFVFPNRVPWKGFMAVMARLRKRISVVDSLTGLVDTVGVFGTTAITTLNHLTTSIRFSSQYAAVYEITRGA